MEGKIKTFTYLSMKVYAYSKVYAWLLIKERCEEIGVQVPGLERINEQNK